MNFYFKILFTKMKNIIMNKLIGGKLAWLVKISAKA